MLPLIEKNRDAIQALCRQYGVKQLELFGSAATGSYRSGQSDIDFLYEMETTAPHLSDRYFGFLEGLEALLETKVDLVSARDARNPYFLQTANRSRITLYAA